MSINTLEYDRKIAARKKLQEREAKQEAEHQAALKAIAPRLLKRAAVKGFEIPKDLSPEQELVILEKYHDRLIEALNDLDKRYGGPSLTNNGYPFHDLAKEADNVLERIAELRLVMAAPELPRQRTSRADRLQNKLDKLRQQGSERMEEAYLQRQIDQAAQNGATRALKAAGLK